MDLKLIAQLDLKEDRQPVYRARRVLRRYHSRWLRCVRGFGWEVTKLEDLAGEGLKARKRMHKTAKRAFEITTTVDLATAQQKMSMADFNKLLVEQAKSGGMLVLYRALDREPKEKLLSSGQVQYSVPTDTSIIRALLEKPKKETI
jgi:hypothetical protein